MTRAGQVQHGTHDQSAHAGRSQCDLILDTLKTGHGLHEWSTWQLMDVSGSLAVHSRIAELRERGHNIEHRRVPRLRGGRRRMVSVYRLVSKQAA